MIVESIQTQKNALSLLLLLVVSGGGLSLLGAGLGGLFLANRALAPAQLAWANQQRFIADASHELRTPLTLLRTDAEVLLRSRKEMAAEDAALLEDIVAEANHMAGLANNLLTLARLDTRSSHQEPEVVPSIGVWLPCGASFGGSATRGGWQMPSSMVWNGNRRGNGLHVRWTPRCLSRSCAQ